MRSSEQDRKDCNESRKVESDTGRRRFWRRLFLGLLVVLALYSLAGFWLLPRILVTQLQKKGPELLDREVTVDRVRFNPFTLHLEIDGLVIRAHSGRAPLFKVEVLAADCAGFLSLYHQALVLEKLAIKGPYLHLVRNPDQSYNFSDLLRSFAAAPKEREEQKKEGVFLFSLNNISLTGGIVEFTDRFRNAFHWINGISISLPRISNLPQLVASRVRPSFSAIVNGTPLKIGGSSKPFDQSRETDLEINIDSLNLPHYLSYLPRDRNFIIGDGSLSTRLELVFSQEPDGKPRLELVGSLHLRNLLIQRKEKDCGRFLFLPEARFVFGHGNLLAGEVFLDEIMISRPQIDLSLQPGGVFYLPKLVKAVSEKSSPPASAGRGGVKAAGEKKNPGRKNFLFRLKRLRLVEGRINYRDARVSPIFKTRFQPVDLELDNLSFPGSERATCTLQLVSESGESLKLGGDFALEPDIDVAARLQVEKVPLARYAPYYSDYFAGRFSGGQAGAWSDIHFRRRADGKMELSLDALKVALADIGLETPNGETVCELPRLVLDRSHLDLDKHEFLIGRIGGEKGSVNLVRRSDGTLNLQDLLPSPGQSSSAPPVAGEPRPETAPAASGSSPGPSWHIRLEQSHLQDFSLDFEDLQPARKASIKLRGLHVKASGLGTAKNESGTVELGFSIADRGAFQLAGPLQLDPLKFDCDLKLEHLPLRLFQPYISEHLDLVLTRGEAGGSGSFHFRLRENRPPEIGFSGDLSFAKVKSVDRVRMADFVGFRQIRLHQLAYSSQPARVALKRMAVDGLRVRLLKERDGHTNLDTILRTPPAPASPAKGRVAAAGAESGSGTPPEVEKTGRKGSGDTGSDAFHFSLETLRLSRGQFSFADYSVSPPFKMVLDKLDGEISGLTSTGRRPAKVSLTGRLNGQAPVVVSGEVNPLAEDLYVDLKISGKSVGLTSLSPYSRKYVGYLVGKGKTTFDLEYRIKNRVLAGRNTIFIDQFDFGSRVESPDATSLPVKLALSLLRDRKGEIHLDLPVRGDLDDPEFSLGGVILKVFVNLITKAVTSPFSLLSGLAGSGEELNQVDFAPGSAELDDNTAARLDKLAKVLYDRPGLEVEIRGRASRGEDRRALHEAAFQRLLKVEKFKELSRDNRAPEGPDQVTVAAGEEFEHFLWLAYKAAPIAKEKNFIGLVRKVEPAVQEKLLRQSIKVGDDELRALARQRAQVVLQYLAAKGPVAVERLFLVEPQLVDGDGPGSRRVEMKIK